MEIRDRIVELRRVPACDLKPHPANWRTHPAEQTAALRDVLTEIGFAGAELAFPADGLGPNGDFSDLMLIDGHARKDLAGQSVVPVLVTDLTAAEALKVLATFDPIGAMAEANAAKLDELLREVEFTSPDVAAMLAALASDAAAAAIADMAKNNAEEGEETEEEDDAGYQTFACPLTADQEQVVRKALRKARVKFGCDSTGAALAKALEEWSDANGV